MPIHSLKDLGVQAVLTHYRNNLQEIFYDNKKRPLCPVELQDYVHSILKKIKKDTAEYINKADVWGWGLSRAEPNDPQRLMKAFYNAYKEKRIYIMTELINQYQGNCTTWQTNIPLDSMKILHQGDKDMYASWKTPQQLIAEGYRPPECFEQITPLYCAIRLNSLNLVKKLVTEGADLNNIYRKGYYHHSLPSFVENRITEKYSALYISAMHEKKEIIKFLLTYIANNIATLKNTNPKDSIKLKNSIINLIFESSLSKEKKAVILKIAIELGIINIQDDKQLFLMAFRNEDTQLLNCFLSFPDFVAAKQELEQQSEEDYDL